jgi:hypothetical protein
MVRGGRQNGSLGGPRREIARVATRLDADDGTVEPVGEIHLSVEAEPTPVHLRGGKPVDEPAPAGWLRRNDVGPPRRAARLSVARRSRLAGGGREVPPPRRTKPAGLK